MAKLYEVNPESFVNVSKGLPSSGRGAWTKRGIGFDYRYRVAPAGETTIGTACERSLDYWAVAAGCWAIQSRLVTLQLMVPVDGSERGIFGKRTEAAVKAFQEKNFDPMGGKKLTVDGIVGMSDARALFTPLVVEAEKRYRVPNDLLLGETNHESVLDPGAVGYYIYYPDYRGVDRAMSQINSKANPQVTWEQAFSPTFSLDWSAKRLRSYYDTYKNRYPAQSETSLWDAAVCAHNNPSAAAVWAKTGSAPTHMAASYVTAVKNAIYLKE